ncbi:toll/interleukin-1 receptor domain-containing protein [Pseudomonas syringae]|uniref:toll/interleukin-1 receptor domain-containing protein n=1 Tax=Pseudomonas syringae TaxID=317 RepID=UPI001F073B4A|nr:toll/interleukin-1 receptor domain-containing protein [Pseudomonas syringae]
MSPKVFVSHAGEDKDRFVLDFAKQLRANGVDAWLDKWEMLPGDSLITKIFEEGIKDAQAIIVVLSKNSVEKPWVKHELDDACVKRINTGSKLIPLLSTIAKFLRF